MPSWCLPRSSHVKQQLPYSPVTCVTMQYQQCGTTNDSLPMAAPRHTEAHPTTAACSQLPALEGGSYFIHPPT